VEPTRLDERGLKHVREKGKDRVKWRKLWCGLALRSGAAVLDARKQLSQDRQVQDERRGEKRVL
jgi:hypothetical protein